MAATVKGRIDWGMSRDEEGHREYKIVWLVKTSSTSDGPATVMAASGLPAVGSYWNFGTESDPWAFCYPNLTVRPLYNRERSDLWEVEQTFSTKPLNRCQDASIENPLNEPPTVKGSFVKFVKKIQQDRHGNMIKSSSHEPIEGLEADDNRPTISIGMNLVSLPLAAYSEMVDTVNDAMLWGLGPRKIKLSNVSWERKLYGLCTFYYTVNYEFDINFKTFDYKVRDRGKRVLIGHSPGSKLKRDPLDPDAIDPETGRPFKDDPKNFEVYKAEEGENTPSFVWLDGKGRPWQGEGAADPVHEFTVEHYEESNFLLLGIPTTF